MHIGETAQLAAHVIDQTVGNLLSKEQECVPASELALTAAQQSKEVILAKGAEVKDRVKETLIGFLNSAALDSDELVGRGIEIVTVVKAARAAVDNFARYRKED